MSSLIIEDWKSVVTRNKVKFIEEIFPVGKYVPDESLPLSEQLYEFAEIELSDYVSKDLKKPVKSRVSSY